MTNIQQVPDGSVPMARRVDAGGWGVLFLWVGVALIAGVGWGMGLLGVGLITLGTQVARRVLGLPREGFWVGIGLFFVVAGAWELLAVRRSLVPFVLITAGLALLVSTLRKARS